MFEFSEFTAQRKIYRKIKEIFFFAEFNDFNHRRVTIFDDCSNYFGCSGVYIQLGKVYCT